MKKHNQYQKIIKKHTSKINRLEQALWNKNDEIYKLRRSIHNLKNQSLWGKIKLFFRD